MPGTVQVVAFQGLPGAYSEQAAHHYFGPGVPTIACRTFAGIFEAILAGQAQFGMLPVENTLAGTVVSAYDALMQYRLCIQAETVIRVNHCLMAPPGTPLEAVKRARSHPQALAQCQHSLRRLGIEPESYYNTAGAAHDLAANPVPGTAVVASGLAAARYGLDILVSNLEDSSCNYTRFLVLAGQEAPRQGTSKTSITFTASHVPGALHRAIGALARQGLNLTKIESRPLRNRPWHYCFLAEFEGHREDEPVRLALENISQCCTSLNVLGSYQVAPPVLGDDCQ